MSRAHATRRVESTFVGSDRLVLFRRSWTGPEPRRAVVLVHGFGEHSGRYDAIGDWLAERGCAVHAHDHRGHGRSAGLRNHVSRFDEYVDDLLELLLLVRAEHEALPLVLVGHSMGGLVVARALVTHPLALACAVLSGAALAPAPGLSRSKIALARVFGAIVPRVRTTSGLPLDGLSRDPDVVRAYEADPFVHTDMTAGLGRALLTTQRETFTEGGRVAVPLLGLHGGDDPICAPWGTERFLEDVRVPGSACKLYPGLRHEIFNEPEREQVWQDLLDFVVRVESGVVSGVTSGRGV